MDSYEAELAYINAPFDHTEIDQGDEDDPDWEPQDINVRRQDTEERYAGAARRLSSRRQAYHFGHPVRVKVGDVFHTREELRKAGVHAAPRAGIHGQRDRGAFSIVMSGVYEDDTDYGDRILYVGTGGLETPEEGPQVANQTFEHSMNKCLVTSMNTRNPVRVIRGSKLRSPFAPGEGFRYDGLYTVEKA
ncbi:PUA-like domain-containing protein [Cubamyces menziesii]|nr:PUA-like domain-containing protein [Cubamyces menziesii]